MILKSSFLDVAILFYGFLLLFSLVMGIDINVKNLIIIFIFSAVFWLITVQQYKVRKKFRN